MSWVVEERNAIFRLCRAIVDLTRQYASKIFGFVEYGWKVCPTDQLSRLHPEKLDEH